jgi:uncharacterized DUF497 family protein
LFLLLAASVEDIVILLLALAIRGFIARPSNVTAREIAVTLVEYKQIFNGVFAQISTRAIRGISFQFLNALL